VSETGLDAKSPLYLVTGGAGFVGGHLVRHLSRQGIRVRAMVRKEGDVPDLRESADEVVVADLNDESSLSEAVNGVSGVYHIAAIFRQEGVDPKTFSLVNADGTRHLLDAAIAAGVPRFIHCSTVGVHGNISNPPADEQAPFAPGDIYQETKLEGEKIAMHYFREGLVSGIVIRPAMIFGPGDLRTLKLFRMISKGIFFYVGSGDVLLHWVDVRDLVAGFQLAMEAEDINNEVYILGGATSKPLKEMVSIIAGQLGVAEPWLHIPVSLMMLAANLTEAICKPLRIEPPIYKRRVSFFLNTRAFDISKARRDLGYSPARTFEEEVADIISEYKRLGLL
jgi:dihydroflavonol-4-reductase